jgi:large subunit ribosomal protein L9
MKLLLKEDVENLGVCGDEVEVKGGYGRNYLIPKGKALLATPKNVKQFAHQKSIVQAKTKKFIDAANAVAEEISKVKCEIKKKVGEQGKLFGSVTAQNIHDLLSEGGVEIDRRKIQLSEPIKTLGEYKVPVKLHPVVTAEINLSVVAEEVAAVEEAPAPAPTPEENA